ncbi:hypothetical protein HMPREF0631_1669 [Peptostreptococcus anaerobius 653-L]|uniref:Uncharacterized protein n=1 Tax=Peptostreptococcus anaerobius 653-L TaxID=596329 RepID=D3MRB2_9FIRM|nr:hypothetical protein HMPREF0631_1669 [Peptostreptococcus anaerobius 653-L]
MTDQDIDEARLRQVVEDAGYEMVQMKIEPYKKTLFGF